MLELAKTVWGGVKAHPLLAASGAGALVLFYVWAHKDSGSSTPTGSFSFNYGPTDSQIKAGTDLAIATAQNQTQVSLAQIAAGMQGQLATINAGTADDYINYLTGASTNSLSALKDSNATQLAITQSNNGAATEIAAGNNATQLAIAQTNSLGEQEYTQLSAGLSAVGSQVTGLGGHLDNLTAYTQGLGSQVAATSAAVGTVNTNLYDALTNINKSFANQNAFDAAILGGSA